MRCRLCLPTVWFIATTYLRYVSGRLPATVSTDLSQTSAQITGPKREQSGEKHFSHPDDEGITFNEHDKAAITRHSYFLQTFKLGHKILLTCEAEGHPTPSITWYKDGAEMHVYHTIYLSQTRLQDYKVRARLEIDPAAIGDEGVYSCLASNRHGYDLKSIKAIYYY
ncbi:Hemicentin-2 [Toxocara canis]|uniref:Hemicentin-2 n=1 Tax=Toxocara canis TaxID=6265 RepID=A0A0B2V4V4_TOXCA|nr:Hemicentin-2 [Toxocara canis]